MAMALAVRRRATAASHGGEKIQTGAERERQLASGRAAAMVAVVVVEVVEVVVVGRAALSKVPWLAAARG